MSLMLLSTSLVSFEVPNIPKLKDLECLATNVYRESRGEPMEGQIAVAKVTLNRLSSSNYPDTICEVVCQPNQFSWTRKYKNIEYDMTSIEASILALNSDDEFKATHFHVKNKKPSWRKRLKEGVTIGNHTFYFP